MSDALAQTIAIGASAGSRLSNFLTPIELLHPRGFVQNAAVIGSNLPEQLASAAAAPGMDLDLVVLAPTEAECRAPGWLEQSIQRLDRSLAADGLVYAVIPRRWRGKARARLARCGIRPGSTYLHLPSWPSSQYLIPLSPAPLRYAMYNLYPGRAVMRNLANAVVSAPRGAESAARLIPSAGLIAQRPGAAARYSWLADLTGEQERPASVLLTASLRKERNSVVLHCFSKDGKPGVVVKTSRNFGEGAAPDPEYRNLERLGDVARQAGARVPRAIHAAQIGPGVCFVEEALPGRSAAAMLSGRPARVPEIIGQISGWLEQWNRATQVTAPAAAARLEQSILAPARELSNMLPGSDGYLPWLAAACAALPTSIPLVTAHNDLTVWNVLVAPGQPVGIVDWREATTESLPLVDLYYALVDAVRVAHRISLEQAFRACCSKQGAYYTLAARLVNVFNQALNLPPGLAICALHACFLHHALNEQREREASDPHPFLAIAQALAQDAEFREVFP